MVDCDIMPLVAGEVGLLDVHLDPQRLAGRHYERLAHQELGSLTYLIAWLDGLPIGHTLVWWTGARDRFVWERISECAHVEDLFVMPEHRSLGVGSQILEYAEGLAAERAFERIGLAVGVDNVRARALYERRGYVDMGFGEFEIGGAYQDAQGRERRWREVCEYLVKRLEPQGRLAADG